MMKYLIPIAALAVGAELGGRVGRSLGDKSTVIKGIPWSAIVAGVVAGGAAFAIVRR